MFSRLSLKYQIALTILVLVAVVLALTLDRTLSAFVTASQMQQMKTEQVILMLLHESSRHALLTEEYENVLQSFTQTQQEPHVLRVLLADAENRVVLSTIPADIGSALPSLTATEDRFWRAIDMKNDAGKLGTLAIEFSTAPLLYAQRTARNLGVSIAATGMILIALVGFGMGFALTRRLGNLRHSAQRLAAGEEHVETGLQGQDEVAQVGQAFDTMARQIAADRTQLRDREARTRAILDTTVDAIITIDEHGIVESFNPAAEQMFGYLAEEVLGHNITLLMPTPYREEHDGYLAHYRTTGEKRIIGLGREVVGQRKDGATFPMDLAVSEMHLNDQRMFTGVVRDISERKLAEAALQASEERFRGLIEGSVQGIVIRRDDTALFVNQAFAEMFGYETPEDIMRMDSLLSLAAPHEHPRLRHYHEARLAGEPSPTHYEFQGVRRDGVLVWLDITIRIINWDGLPTTQVTVVDITPRKQAEQALRESEARLRQIAETIQEFFWISDPHLPRHLYVSPAYETIWGRTCESLYTNPMSWLEAVHPEDREIGRSALETLRRGEPREVEYRITRPDGSIRWIRDRGFPITDRNGEVYRLTGVAEDITAKKEVEAELNRSYALFHALIENTSDIICVIDAEGVISYYSPSVERVLGYRREELMGRHVFGAFHPGDVSHIKAMIATVLDHPGHTQRVEYRARHLDGLWHDFEAMASSPPEGLLMGSIVVNARDITERKQTEQELLESEIRFRDLVEGSIQGIMIHRNGQPLFVNQAFADIFGYDHLQDILTTLDTADLIAPHERSRLRQMRDDRLAGKEIPNHYDYQGLHKDGTLVWLESRVRVITWEGAPAIQSTVVDITERKQAEQALRESEGKFRDLVEGSLQGISITRNGKRLFANPALATIFGHECAEDLIGQDARELIAPHEQARIAAYRQTRSQGEAAPERYELQGIRKDGTYVWIENIASMIAWEGEPATMTTLIDITARKDAEAALRKANDELEQRVQERTAALEVANEEVKRFAYIVSHDLRAPLVNLKGFANELRDTCSMIQAVLPKALPHLDKRQQRAVTTAFEQDMPEALGFIDSSVNRMDGLIQAVLNLSRAGNRELYIEPVDTEELVHDIVQTLTHQLTESQAQVSIGTLPEIQADRTAMEQILGNLLSNAVKYLDPGRPGDISVTAESGDDVTTFHIQDNGRGIAEADIPLVFELFRRVGQQDVQGEGMGLTYVQTLVRRHGGEIRCESALGVGTAFSFTISTHLAQGDTT